MSEWDRMKVFARYDGEVDDGDFLPEEMEELLSDGKERAETLAEYKRRYFAEHDDVKVASLEKHKWSD